MIIYAVQPDDPFDMKYKAAKKITKKIDCDLLFCLMDHIIVSKGNKVQLFNFSGVIEREWILDDEVTFMKVMGGAPGREGVVLALKNGGILKLFADNAFPVKLVKPLTNAIMTLDISGDREKLAVVDEYDNMFVYNLRTQ